jgi:hypothetical protein
VGGVPSEIVNDVLGNVAWCAAVFHYDLSGRAEVAE